MHPGFSTTVSSKTRHTEKPCAPFMQLRHYIKSDATILLKSNFTKILLKTNMYIHATMNTSTTTTIKPPANTTIATSAWQSVSHLSLCFTQQGAPLLCQSALPICLKLRQLHLALQVSKLDVCESGVFPMRNHQVVVCRLHTFAFRV